MKTFISDLSKTEFPIRDKVSAKLIRASILDLIEKEHPEFNKNGCLSISELNMFRQKYLAEYLIKETGELSELENTVLHSLKNRKTLVDKIESTEVPITLGQRVADHVATFGGSWRFIISFGVFLLLWIIVNAFILLDKSFDPYPFILLNLILSCIAALQAPVIMMSQNRQEEKDRQRAENDYLVNLKAEIEIRSLHQKLDLLLQEQLKTLYNIQHKQLELLNAICDKVNAKHP